MRGLVRSFPDIQFASLQPDNDAAKYDLEQAAVDNIYVEDTVRPLEDIDSQLCLVAALDKVVGIDNSALHFAGALGKSGAVLLTGEPTWQWPLQTSFYPSIVTAKSIEELKTAIRGPDETAYRNRSSSAPRDNRTG